MHSQHPCWPDSLYLDDAPWEPPESCDSRPGNEALEQSLQYAMQLFPGI